MDYLFVICLAILVFFIASILSRKSKYLSDYIFIVWLFLVALTEITFFLSSLDLFKDYYWFYEMTCASHVLHGVLFYLYVLSLINSKFSLEKKHLLHLIPIGIYLGYKSFTKSVGLVDCLEEGGCSHSDNFYAIASVYLKFVIILGYVVWGYYKILKVSQNPNNKNHHQAYGIKWLRSIGNGVITLLGLVFLIKILASWGVQFVIDQVMVINIVVSLFVVSFIYIYTKYSYIFAHPLNVSNESISTDKEQIHNEISESDPYFKNFEMICEFIENNKAYTDGDLTLRKLSDQVNLPEHLISQSINRYAEKTYSDFINTYRIQHFIYLIKNGAHREQTILYLAFECGFNSKSSFNRVFKQFYNTTPTEFIKAQQ